MSCQHLRSSRSGFLRFSPHPVIPADLQVPSFLASSPAFRAVWLSFLPVKHRKKPWLIGGWKTLNVNFSGDHHNSIPIRFKIQSHWILTSKIHSRDSSSIWIWQFPHPNGWCCDVWCAPSHPLWNMVPHSTGAWRCSCTSLPGAQLVLKIPWLYLHPQVEGLDNGFPTRLFLPRSFFSFFDFFSFSWKAVLLWVWVGDEFDKWASFHSYVMSLSDGNRKVCTWSCTETWFPMLP